MPTPAVSLKLRKIRRRFGIAAPKVVVRSHVPWQWLVLAALMLLCFLVVAGWLLLQRNQAGEIGLELQALRVQLHSQQEELDTLRSSAGTRQNAMSIEQATQRQLLTRIKELERENVALKEDMLMFERLIPVVGDEALLRAENFRVLREDDGKYRYRLLLAYQPTRQKPEFVGHLQLIAQYVLAGRTHHLSIPEKQGGAPEYQVSIRHFLRREGTLPLPAGARLLGLEVQIVQGGTLMVRKSAQI